MLLRIPILLFTLFCLNIPLLSQPASRRNNAQGEKPLAGLEKKIKENLESAAAESATLKIPENRAFLYFRVADLLWDFDEEGARALIEESRVALSRLVSSPDYNPSNSQAGYLNSPKNTPSIAEGLDGDEFGIVGASPTMNSAFKAL